MILLQAGRSSWIKDKPTWMNYKSAVRKTFKTRFGDLKARLECKNQLPNVK